MSDRAWAWLIIGGTVALVVLANVAWYLSPLGAMVPTVRGVR